MRPTLILLSLVTAAGAQLRPAVAPEDGIRQRTPAVHAIVGARVVPRPGRLINDGTVVIRDGRIEAVGATDKTPVPADARRWPGAGLTVYPGLIESDASVGLPGDDELRQRAGSHWNHWVHAELRAADVYRRDADALEQLRAVGFTTALVSTDVGLFHGRSVLVHTGDGEAGQAVLRADVAQHISLKTVSRPRQSWADVRYPGSLMGSIALVRQTLYDAGWYGRSWAAHRKKPQVLPAPQLEPALDALGPVLDGGLVVLAGDGDDQGLVRAARVAGEFDLEWIGRGTGAEYRILGHLDAGARVIVPVDFPPAPDVSDPEDALTVSLKDLQHWEAAPANAARLQGAGVAFALTSDGLESRADFPARVRRAIDYGLDADAALAALTTTPAAWFGVGDQLGTIDRGKRAHLVVTDGDLFAEDTRVLDVWVDGVRHVVEHPPQLDLRGDWVLRLDLPDETVDLALHLEGKTAAVLKAKVRRDSLELQVGTVRLEHRRLTLTVAGDSLGYEGHFRLSAVAGDSGLSGQGRAPVGWGFSFSAWRTDSLAAAPDTTADAAAGDDEPEPPDRLSRLPAVRFPAGAYGVEGLPAQPPAVIVRNATLWTSGPAGILEDTDMLVEAGKIRAIGRDLKAPEGAASIDAEGLHVTPGLVDAHTHIGGRGFNEWAQAVSAEVRIADALDPADLSIYRHMAQGTTVSHIMHGSANPIGGQNATIKHRWGAGVDGLLVDGAAPTIKFALGENVKQSNWGDGYRSRYPQTRMGVEAIIRDRLTAAREYGQAMAAGRGPHGLPARRDLELDALLEVLEGKRLVHCHSYRQDEILMLIRVAEDFGFRVGTFQHVLEGYKIAEAIADHGASASTFSDWWGYKFEVRDATPYNAALMHRVGVRVSINSDIWHYGGRIHLDAAKAVKYGGVSQEDALRMVTIEPARQLGIDHRTGSLEPGKDADFVVWSASPLSAYARCEQTWIDGRPYFRRLVDERVARTHVDTERARLIQAVLNEGDDE